MNYILYGLLNTVFQGITYVHVYECFGMLSHVQRNRCSCLIMMGEYDKVRNIIVYMYNGTSVCHLAVWCVLELFDTELHEILPLQKFSTIWQN